MKLQDLTGVLENCKGKKVVGVTVTYDNGKCEFKKVEYFYNPCNDTPLENRTIASYITETSLIDCTAFDTYTLGYATNGEIFVTSHEKITFRELLSDKIKGIEIHAITLIRA